jgi:hypothetical protein
MWWQGKTHTEDAKIKMSESAKLRKRPATSDETKARISKANKGRRMSEENILKRTGEKRSEEARFNMSQAQLGKKLSEETKKQTVLSSKGAKIFSRTFSKTQNISSK